VWRISDSPTPFRVCYIKEKLGKLKKSNFEKKIKKKQKRKKLGGKKRGKSNPQ
jgi:hypothetical protein